MKIRTPPLAAVLAAIALCAPTLARAQGWTDSVRLNQVGFYPGGPKEAVVLGSSAGPFHVATVDLADTLFTGTLGPPLAAESWSDTTRLADFSALQTPGGYVVVVPGLGYSYPFQVRPRVHGDLARAAVKSFYYARASTPIRFDHAGRWARPAGHPDTAVLVHPSAASPTRPEGTVLSLPGGWYDAGDYNKYVVNSGITTGTLLSLYEDFPAVAASLDLDIPESRNALPDLLDEALYNLRWMLSMQDPADGGVYHKLTEAEFEGFVAPDQARYPRYVVQKSTAAALNLAAVAAQASRILRRFEHATPGLADSCLTVSVRAWNWARRNPDVLYDQAEMNRRFDPDVNTGGYGDRNVADEFAWAAAELYVTTRQDSFYTAVPIVADTAAVVPTWNQVRALAYYTLARFRADLPQRPAADRARVEGLLVELGDGLLRNVEERPYRSVMGGSRRDFVWGSNAVAGNQGIALIQAFRITGEQRYLRGALGNLDYILGRNATGYSFVTGFGTRQPMNPHNRIAASDPVLDPMPGYIVGGPNPGRQDRCEYPSVVPEKAFVDDVCSYASNETAINWNAPFAYLAVAIEALQFEIGTDHAPLRPASR